MSELFPEDEDRCVDVIDQACKVEQRLRANSVALARGRAAPEQVQQPVLDEAGEPMLDGAGQPLMYWPVTECVDCDDDIPPARLALGRVRCITCQSKKELKEKQYGGR